MNVFIIYFYIVECLNQRIQYYFNLIKDFEFNSQMNALLHFYCGLFKIYYVFLLCFLIQFYYLLTF